MRWCPTDSFNDFLRIYSVLTLTDREHSMPYMIPYYQSGILVTFRCTDCDWTYTIGNPSTSPVPRDEEEKAKEQYVAHRCSEFSSKTAKK